MSSLPLHPNGRINYDAVIQAYAKEMDWEFSKAVRFLAERPSLQMAAECLGINEGSYKSTESRKRLNQLGQYLDRKGYTVPKLFDLGKEQFEKESVSEVPFTLTKEQYLEQRRTGKSRSQIAKDQGIALPSLYPHLEKWGIRDAAVEEAELDRNEKPAEAPLPASAATPTPVDNKVDKPQSEQFVEAPKMDLESYLKARNEGLSRSQAFSKFKLGPIAGEALLKKWHVYDRSNEKAVLLAYQGGGLDAVSQAIVSFLTPKNEIKHERFEEKALPVPISEIRSEVPQDIKRTDNTGSSLYNEKFLVIRIPFSKTMGRVALDTSKIVRENRNHHLDLSINVLVGIVAGAVEDIMDLLGPEADTLQLVQSYIDRKIAEILAHADSIEKECEQAPRW